MKMSVQNRNKNLILVIDTTLDDQLVVFLADQTGSIKKRAHRAHRQSEKLLPAAQEILSEFEARLEDLRAIFVATGGGSYTSLKVAAAMANALGWALDIPVLPLAAEDCKTLGKLKKVIDKLIIVEAEQAFSGCGGGCAACGMCSRARDGVSAKNNLSKHFTGPLEPEYADKADWEK